MTRPGVAAASVVGASNSHDDPVSVIAATPYQEIPMKPCLHAFRKILGVQYDGKKPAAVGWECLRCGTGGMTPWGKASDLDKAQAFQVDREAGKRKGRG